MNRQERRKMERQGVSKKTLMDRTILDTYEKGYKEGMKAVSEIVFYMTAYTLQYKLDFGKKRLQAIMKSIYGNIDAYRTKHLNTQDYETIKSEMENKYGVKIV